MFLMVTPPTPPTKPTAPVPPVLPSAAGGTAPASQTVPPAAQKDAGTNTKHPLPAKAIPTPAERPPATLLPAADTAALPYETMAATETAAIQPAAPSGQTPGNQLPASVYWGLFSVGLLVAIVLFGLHARKTRKSSRRRIPQPPAAPPAQPQASAGKTKSSFEVRI